MSGPDRVGTAARQLAAGVWREHWRIITTGAVALAGLSLLALGPAGLAFGVLHYSERADAGQLDPHPLGTAVRDGQVTFVAHEIRCGQAEPPEATHGRLCEVTIGARNDGTYPVAIPGNRQLLAGPGGARHLPLPAEEEQFGTLAPGAAVVGVLRYDLPAHAEITHLLVYAGAYTAGASVALDGPPLPR